MNSSKEKADSTIMDKPINNEVISLDHVTLPGRVNRVGRLMAKAAIDKGLEVNVISPKLFTVTGDEKSEMFVSNMASSISHVDKKITSDKALTKKFMQRVGVKSPEGIVFDVKKGRDDAVAFMERYDKGPLVLKPLDGNMGINVFLDITDSDDMLRKCDIISKRFKSAILEEQMQGTECRYFVVGDQVKGVMLRKPASVLGNGKETIKELVESKNSGRKDRLGLKQIKIDDETLSLLGEQGVSVDTVPKTGQHIQLKRVSNLSQGGDSVDITDDVHQEIKDIAVTAMKSMPTLSYAGIDVIADDHFSPASDQNVYVLEVNWQPMMDMHHAPAYGKARNVCGDVIDHLFFGK